MRVALVTTIPAPYRTPVWDALSQLCGELAVFSCAPRESDRIWDVSGLDSARFTHTHLPGLALYIRRLELGVYVNPSIVRELRRMRPDAIVVTGYQTPTFIAAIEYAKLRQIPLVLWWESHAGSSRVKGGVVGTVRSRLIRQSDAYVTVGSRATDYLVQMGVASAEIFTGVNAVDVGVFEPLSPNIARAATRDRTSFLYVGQLIERKGIRDLLEAFRELPAGEAQLKIIGYGPLDDKLRAYAARHGMSNVEFAGASRTLHETAAHYSAADFVVVPSRFEVWGLVVNESLAAGAPVIVSRQAGATPDLVERAPVRVGLTFDAGDKHSLIDALRRASSDREGFDREAIARWGRSFTPVRLAGSIHDAIIYAVAKLRPDSLR